jgi:hypothetical protein
MPLLTGTDLRSWLFTTMHDLFVIPIRKTSVHRYVDDALPATRLANIWLAPDLHSASDMRVDDYHVLNNSFGVH